MIQKMGPDCDTPKWWDQVSTIFTAIMGTKDLTTTDIDTLLMMYILDESYSRSAISQARKLLLDQIGANNT